MKKFTLYKLVAFMILASMMLAAFMVPQQAAQAQSDLVGFTFINKSDKLASLRLYGDGDFYYFLLRPGESKYYTPARGVYQMSFFSCGQYTNKELDLTKQTKMIVPPCGFKAYSNKDYHPGVIDGGEIIKLVKITFENATDRYMKVILEGPAVYVFTFDKDQSKTYTISKGDYTYTAYGCGGTFYGSFYAHEGKVYDFKCP